MRVPRVIQRSAEEVAVARWPAIIIASAAFLLRVPGRGEPLWTFQKRFGFVLIRACRRGSHQSSGAVLPKDLF